MRTETFVFEFENQELFAEFFQKYYPLTKDKVIPGMKCLGVAIGNKMEKYDELVNLIGDLYDNCDTTTTDKKKLAIFERAEKILGI